MSKMTSGDWKGDTAKGARRQSEWRAKYYDRLERERKKKQQEQKKTEAK